MKFAKFVGVYLAVAALSIQAPLFAQDAQSFIELLRSDLKTEKKAVYTLAMGFTEKEAETFWPIYNEYENELGKLGDQRIILIKDYAASFKTMSNEKAMAIVQRALKLQSDRIDLRRKYFEKVSKELGAIVGAKFAQVDNQIQLIIDLQIASEMPLVSKPAPADSAKPAGEKK